MLAIGEGLDKRLDRLEGELAALRQQRREAQAELGAAVADVQRLDAELEAGAEEDALALAAGGSPGADRRKLHGELVKAKARPDALRRKLTGIERAIERKESETATFVAGHQAELFAKHAPTAAARAQHVRAAAEALQAAITGWHQAADRSSRLLAPVPGMTGQDVPALNLDVLTSELRRALARDLPVPLPRSLTGPHDPIIGAAA